LIALEVQLPRHIFGAGDGLALSLNRFEPGDFVRGAPAHRRAIQSLLHIIGIALDSILRMFVIIVSQVALLVVGRKSSETTPLYRS
jgi:hypothetical protein